MRHAYHLLVSCGRLRLHPEYVFSAVVCGPQLYLTLFISSALLPHKASLNTAQQCSTAVLQGLTQTQGTVANGATQ